MLYAAAALCMHVSVCAKRNAALLGRAVKITLSRRREGGIIEGKIGEGRFGGIFYQTGIFRGISYVINLARILGEKQRRCDRAGGAVPRFSCS